MVPKTQGVGFNVTPEEWFAFATINAVRISKGLLMYPLQLHQLILQREKIFTLDMVRSRQCDKSNKWTGLSACLNVNSGDISTFILLIT